MPHDSSTLHYDSDLIGGSLMVRESRIVAELLLAGVVDATREAAILDENPSRRRGRQLPGASLAQAIRKRLERLPEPFWQVLHDGDDQLATQVCRRRSYKSVKGMRTAFTDVYKVYLSPMIDCFDGLVVSWTIGTRPDAELVNTMLGEAIDTLDDDERPIVHSDRGCSLPLARLAIPNQGCKADTVDVS